MAESEPVNNPEAETPLRQVVKAAIRRGDLFLILKKKPTARYFANHWDFPGGKVESGENPISALHREVSEELGIDVNVGNVLGNYDLNLDGGEHCDHKVTVYDTAADIKNPGQIESPEGLELKWATKEQILQLPIEPWMEPLLASL